MIELPEAIVLARQLNDTVRGKRITHAAANASPHKFAWYSGDPAAYAGLLQGRTLGEARGFGSRVELDAGDLMLCFCEGINLRFYADEKGTPEKHQLLLTFQGGGALAAAVAMYGGIFLDSPEAIRADKYHKAAMEAVSAVGDAFTPGFFNSLLSDGALKLSAKAFLATQQRIPGLGNGVLQDILYNARVSPKRRVNTLSTEELAALYVSIRKTLSDMARLGGRDTEKDLYGEPGGYATVMSRNTAGRPCPRCGETVKKEAYMGGSVYLCPGCQKA